MRQILMAVTAVIPRIVQAGACQDAKTVLNRVANAMGATGLMSMQYAARGPIFAVGQRPNPTAPWLRFNAKSYPRSMNYG